MAASGSVPRFAMRVEEAWLSNDLSHATEAEKNAIEPKEAVATERVRSRGPAAAPGRLTRFRPLAAEFRYDDLPEAGLDRQEILSVVEKIKAWADAELVEPEPDPEPES